MKLSDYTCTSIILTNYGCKGHAVAGNGNIYNQISCKLVEKLWNQVSLFLAGFNNFESQCSAASTTTQFDAETLDAVSAAYCTTHHLTSMESLWEKSGKTKTSLLQSYCLWKKQSRAHSLILTVPECRGLSESFVRIQRIMFLPYLLRQKKNNKNEAYMYKLKT